MIAFTLSATVQKVEYRGTVIFARQHIEGWCATISGFQTQPCANAADAIRLAKAELDTIMLRDRMRRQQAEACQG